ncbi:MAG: hypothetical protein WBO36_01480 [Saprospiraceae bacterium]
MPSEQLDRIGAIYNLTLLLVGCTPSFINIFELSTAYATAMYAILLVNWSLYLYYVPYDTTHEGLQFRDLTVNDNKNFLKVFIFIFVIVMVVIAALLIDRANIM